jgi:hypothetical protein
MVQYSIINGKTFEILENLKHPQSMDQDRIALFQDRVCLLSRNRCYFREGVEDWLQETKESKWIKKEHQKNLIEYLNIVLIKMTAYKRTQTIYELLDRDNYYNSLILAC